jgi:hypothetical protein
MRASVLRLPSCWLYSLGASISKRRRRRGNGDVAEQLLAQLQAGFQQLGTQGKVPRLFSGITPDGRQFLVAFDGPSIRPRALISSLAEPETSVDRLCLCVPASDGSIGYHLRLSKPTVVGIKRRKVVERDTKIAAVWPVKPFIDCDRAVDHAAKPVETQEYLIGWMFRVSRKIRLPLHQEARQQIGARMSGGSGARAIELPWRGMFAGACTRRAVKRTRQVCTDVLMPRAAVQDNAAPP